MSHLSEFGFRNSLMMLIGIKFSYFLCCFKHHGRALVCMPCQSEGFSPKDSTTYECANKCKRGHLCFDSIALRSHKSRGTAMYCKACKEREGKLLTQLRMKNSWKCSCKKMEVGTRAYAALYNNAGHKEHCDLHPRMHGERRWDGQNNGITLADLEFLANQKGKY